MGNNRVRLLRTEQYRTDKNSHGSRVQTWNLLFSDKVHSTPDTSEWIPPILTLAVVLCTCSRIAD